MPLNYNLGVSAYPKVTIITPSLNQGQFIEATIQSVLSQRYPNLEYIVIDGGSSDNTLSILNTYSDRLRWVSEKDSGQTHAVNKGLKMAAGDIVGYLNADDLLLDGTLLKISRKFEAAPDIMWVTGQCRIIDEEDREIRKLITAYKNFWLRFPARSSLLITDYISQPATFWRVSTLNEFGYLDEKLHYAMDYDFWLRIYSKYPPAFIPEYLAAFRIHTQSKNTNSGHKDVYIDEERIVIQRHTRSKSLQVLHNLHRWLMTTVYSVINKR
jgi:glycosyltransferase involved in cell wall biosynthesis